MNVEAVESCMDAPSVRLLWDSGPPDRDRTVALEAGRPWPEPVRSQLEEEGLQVGERRVAGAFEALRAALLRWPRGFEGLGGAIGDALGLKCSPEKPWRFGAVEIPSGKKSLVMGILNVTPDSFYDGGRYADREAAVRRALQMVEEGADVIDVGGESTRPGSEPVDAEVEAARVVPVIEALRERVPVPISVDTYKAPVAEAALKAGACIVNDITGLHADPRMAKVAAEHGATVVVMHIKGTPKTMQQNPAYADLLGEVRAYLEEGCELALKAGVPEDRIWIDPGIGFGKTAEHNLELLRRLRFFRALGFPILVGTSNKSVIGQVLGLPVHDRLEGTAATVAVAIANGADGVRIHDVQAMKRVSAMADAIVRARAGEGP